MKINGWTEIQCATPECVYCDDKGDCFYPGPVKLNQKCENFVPGKVKVPKFNASLWGQVKPTTQRRSIPRKH